MEYEIDTFTVILNGSNSVCKLLPVLQVIILSILGDSRIHLDWRLNFALDYKMHPSWFLIRHFRESPCVVFIYKTIF